MDRIAYEIEAWERLARVARAIAADAERRGKTAVATEAHCLGGEAQREARTLARLRATT